MTRKMAAFRLPLEAIAQVDLLARALQRRSPGKVSQADAVAWAVARGLAEVEDSERKAEGKRLFELLSRPKDEEARTVHAVTTRSEPVDTTFRTVRVERSP